jgi:hypothetical protein
MWVLSIPLLQGFVKWTAEHFSQTIILTSTAKAIAAPKVTIP